MLVPTLTQMRMLRGGKRGEPKVEKQRSDGTTKWENEDTHYRTRVQSEVRFGDSIFGALHRMEGRLEKRPQIMSSLLVNIVFAC